MELSNNRATSSSHAINDSETETNPSHNPLTNEEKQHLKDTEDFSFFAAGRDFETVFTNHQYTKSERKLLNTFKSLDYLPSHSEVYKTWLLKQPRRLDWDRWLMMGMIGFTVGLIGFLLHQFIDLLGGLKWSTAQSLLSNNGIAICWLFMLAFGLITISVASIIVLLQPSAASSGIPQLIGYLNGTHVPQIFNVKTLVVKFFSCILAIGGGLPAGPEGPMLHLGSMVGAGLSQFRSETMGCRLPFFTRFRNSEDKRNFISAGAAAGIASAFGAPVGGLLFSMEEVSSFWDLKLSWQTFFCCMVSTFTTDIFNSAFEKFQYKGEFGVFKTENYILFQVHKAIPLNVLVFIPTIIIGVVGGSLGGLFVIFNLKISRLRNRILAFVMRKSTRTILANFVRLLEPVLIILIFTTLSAFVPAAFNCSPFRCRGEHVTDSVSCLTTKRDSLLTETTVINYTCPTGVLIDKENISYTNRTYNQAATLLFTTGERVIDHLFSRQTHLEFDESTLAVVLVIYMPLACWCAGTSISTGLVVPMFLIGGLYGRILGRLMVRIFGVHTTGYWAWIDPGAFALIGAASFMGGVSRLTMSLTVIMMEITNDIQFLLPVMVSIMTAKWIGDLISHPLYHSLLELRCIPFLTNDVSIYQARKTRNTQLSENTPRKTTSLYLNLELFTASHVMRSPVHCLLCKATLSRLTELLTSTKHCSFPIVESEECQRFLGTVNRHDLLPLIKSEVVGSQPPTYEDLIYDGKSRKPEDILQQATNTLEEERQRGAEEHTLDLAPYMNQSAVRVPLGFSLQRTFILLRSLGLRQLVVVDSNNVTCGIITRKDLMGFSVEESIDHALHEEDTDITIASNTQINNKLDDDNDSRI